MAGDDSSKGDLYHSSGQVKKEMRLKRPLVNRARGKLEPGFTDRIQQTFA